MLTQKQRLRLITRCEAHPVVHCHACDRSWMLWDLTDEKGKTPDPKGGVPGTHCPRCGMNHLNALLIHMACCRHFDERRSVKTRKKEKVA